MNKHDLSERGICSKFITPALRGAGWDEVSQIPLRLNQMTPLSSW